MAENPKVDMTSKAAQPGEALDLSFMDDEKPVQPAKPPMPEGRLRRKIRVGIFMYLISVSFIGAIVGMLFHFLGAASNIAFAAGAVSGIVLFIISRKRIYNFALESGMSRQTYMASYSNFAIMRAISTSRQQSRAFWSKVDPMRRQCRHCQGTGVVKGTFRNKRCPACGGSGREPLLQA